MKARLTYHFIFFLLLFADTLSAQDSTQDSLFTIWKDPSQADSVRAAAFHRYTSDGYLNSNPDSALQLAKVLYDFANERRLDEHQAKALRLQGLAYQNLGETTNSIQKFRQVLLRFETTKNRKGQSQIYLDIGHLKQDLLEYDSSNFYFDKALVLFEEAKDEASQAKCYQKKSRNAINQSYYDKAMEFAFESLRIWEKLNDSAGIASAHINISDALYYQENYGESVDYAKKALRVFKKTKDIDKAADAFQNVAESYLILAEYDSALANINQALRLKKAIEAPPLRIGSLLNTRGNVQKYREEHDKALADYQEVLEIVEGINFELGIMSTTANVGHVHILKEEYAEALPFITKAIEMMEASENRLNLAENYLHAFTIYENLGKYDKALEFHKKYSDTKDSIFSAEKDYTMSELRTRYETEKKEEQISTLEKEAELRAQAEERERQVKLLLIGVAFLLLLFAVGLWSRLRFIRKSRTAIQKEKDRSENLLLNILPEEIAHELKEKGRAEARDFERVSILFTDFESFTQTSTQMSAKELVSELNICFEAFDGICEKYSIEKIKTIGDAYMTAGGLPIPTEDSVKNTVLAALAMQDFILKRKAESLQNGTPTFAMRAGIHSGSVVAGIVGVKKFQYDIWGDSVNTASRMESAGEVGRVNVSQATYELLKNDSDFHFESRGKIAAKGKGEIEMWFVKI